MSVFCVYLYMTRYICVYLHLFVYKCIKYVFVHSGEKTRRYTPKYFKWLAFSVQ